MKQRLLLLLGIVFSSVTLADQIPIEAFFKLPQYAEMKISPDGKYLAALSPFKGRQNLVVIEIETWRAQPVSDMESRDIVWFRWINSKRLLLRTGTLAAQVDNFRGDGLYAVDRDGGYGRQLSAGVDEGKEGNIRFVYRPLHFLRTLPGETDDIIAQEYNLSYRKSSAGELYRLNTRTGRKTSISLGKPDSADSEYWLVDSTGVARVFAVRKEGKVGVHYRADGDAPWTRLDEFGTSSPGWAPLAVDETDNTIFVSSHLGRDKAGIFKFDPRTRSFGQPVAEHPRVDLKDIVVEDDGKVAGVTYDADTGGAAWFDERLAALQKSVDAALPDKVNVMSWSRGREKILIRSYSDTSPGAFYLLDTVSGKMRWLADRSPWIKPELMSPMKAVRYAARDGLEIPAYVTLPRGSSGRNLPLVVIPHGGPWVHGDSWGFRPDVQFLASRGYAVLQPNFRGTTRYGWKHLSSSFRQWGLAMQDDISDGVLWAIKEGIADKDRVCIFGASYGGYAALMGLVKTPELYKCAVDYVGVTDIKLMYSVSWSDFAYSDYIRYDAKVWMGDPDKDAEQLKATSPLLQAERIQAPVLMAYGGADHRVPLIHGEEMRDALARYNKKYEWMVMPGEGHGFRELGNQVKFYGAVEKFLKENVGPKE